MMKADARTIHLFNERGMSALEYDTLQKENARLRNEVARLKRMLRATERRTAEQAEAPSVIH